MAQPTRPKQAAKLEALLQQGLTHHQAGRLAEAEACYRQVLAEVPAHPHALNLLGVIASQVGRHDVALGLIGQAIAAKPGVAEFHNNLGLALQALGRLADAEMAYRQSLRLNNRYPEAYNNLGTVLQDMGKQENALESFKNALSLRRDYAEAHFNAGNALIGLKRYAEGVKSLEQAIALRTNYSKARCALGLALQHLKQFEPAESAYRKALEIQPNYAEAHCNLSSLLREQGRLEEAERALLRALEIDPKLPEALNGLGELWQIQGKLPEAEEKFRQAIVHKPSYADAHNNLGVLFSERGHLEQAIASFLKAIEVKPGFVAALSNLGNAYLGQGRLDEALACYRQAISSDPEFALAYSNLGNVFLEQGLSSEAGEQYRRALELQPDLDVTHSNLGASLVAQGNMEEAEAAYRQALQINPANAVAHSNLIFAMDFDPHLDTAAQQAERRRWNDIHAKPLRGKIRPHENDRNPDRRLRIGYVSADFRMHSAAFTFEPMLCRYDKENFEVYCYSNSSRNDQMTERFRNCVTGWRNIVGKSDADADAMIRADKIDILVDFAAHSAGNRLLLFARKPAPIQVTGWGHAHGTGMEAMDYLFSDPVSIPPDECHYFAERVTYLPCLIPYSCPDNAPPVMPLPAMKNDYVTFGCFSRLIKISESSLALWAELLRSIPQARMVIKARELDDTVQKLRLVEKMAGFGVSGERLTLLGQTTWYEHMAAYGGVDVALDPFPHGGGIGSFEALWMGVPVVTIKGPSLPSRVTAAIETALGLEDWVADNQESYLALARNKASNLGALAELRMSLREQVKASPAGNPVTITKMVEQSYRKMWREWLTNKEVQK